MAAPKDKKPKVRGNWGELETEYITSSMSMRELASKHGIKAAGLMARAAKEKWEEKRKQFQADLSKRAVSGALPERAELLAKFNEEDLKVARGLRAMIVNQMTESKGKMDPSQIRALAGAASEAQRIGRLALGAETENSTVTTRMLEPLPDDAFLG